jgi:hypothetical protein
MVFTLTTLAAEGVLEEVEVEAEAILILWFASASSPTMRSLPCSFARVLFGQMQTMSVRCEGQAQAQTADSGQADPADGDGAGAAEEAEGAAARPPAAAAAAAAAAVPAASVPASVAAGADADAAKATCACMTAAGNACSASVGPVKLGPAPPYSPVNTALPCWPAYSAAMLSRLAFHTHPSASVLPK